MTLQDAIEEVKREAPKREFKWTDVDWVNPAAIATILNAVVKGELK